MRCGTSPTSPLQNLKVGVCCFATANRGRARRLLWFSVWKWRLGDTPPCWIGCVVVMSGRGKGGWANTLDAELFVLP